MTHNNVRRNGEIEFWRFIFSVIIMIHHSRWLLGDANCKFLGGSFAVEFFFLVSGYLMIAAIQKKLSCPDTKEELGPETLTFLWKKVKVVLPGVITAWVIALVLTSIAQGKSIRGFVGLAIDSFFEVSLIKMSGIYSVSLNGVVWYISSMLLCMAVLYPLIRKWPNMMKCIVLPLIVLLCLGYLGGNFSDPRNPLVWIGFTKKGNIRALAEISLGALLWCVVDRASGISFTRGGKILISITKWCAYVVVILFMYYMKASNRDYFFLLILTVAVGLSFSHQGVEADLFDRPLFIWLGKYSLYLYLGHTYHAENLKLLLPADLADTQKMAAYVLCSVVTSFVIWAMVIVVKRLTPGATKLLKKWFIADFYNTAH